MLFVVERFVRKVLLSKINDSNFTKETFRSNFDQACFQIRLNPVSEINGDFEAVICVRN